MTHICNICKSKKETSEIIILLCKHMFCWSCIEQYVKNNLKNKIKCPDALCIKIMKDNEVRKVLSEDDIARYNNICLQTLPNSYTCVLPGCGRVLLIDSVNIQFDCNYCTVFNCVQCKKAHKGMRCGELISSTRQSLQAVCQAEMDRASSILQSKEAEMKRADILKMEKRVLVSNSGIFTCELCCTDIAKQKGIILRGCFHQICRNCLAEHIKNASLIPIQCPFSPCKGILEDRECREILSESEKTSYETRSIKYASKYLEKPDRCRQVNCIYLYDLEKTVKDWTCPLCKSLNCVTCNMIHANQTCQEYLNSKVLSKDDLKIEDQIKRKELMRCPDCKNLIKKTRGCNWIPCSNCGVELCWINQIHRWGPKGPGDTSGGCRCGVNNVMCHPTCSGCIADIGRRHIRYTSIPLDRAPLTRSARFNRSLHFNDYIDRQRGSDLFQPIVNNTVDQPPVIASGSATNPWNDSRRPLNRVVRPHGRGLQSLRNSANPFTFGNNRNFINLDDTE